MEEKQEESFGEQFGKFYQSLKYTYAPTQQFTSKKFSLVMDTHKHCL
jgi:hypothetical protein